MRSPARRLGLARAGSGSPAAGSRCRSSASLACPGGVPDSDGARRPGAAPPRPWSRIQLGDGELESLLDLARRTRRPGRSSGSSAPRRRVGPVGRGADCGASCAGAWPARHARSVTTATTVRRRLRMQQNLTVASGGLEAPGSGSGRPGCGIRSGRRFPSADAGEERTDRGPRGAPAMATHDLRAKALILHPDDDVVIAKAPIPTGTVLDHEGERIEVRVRHPPGPQDRPAGPRHGRGGPPLRPGHRLRHPADRAGRARPHAQPRGGRLPARVRGRRRRPAGRLLPRRPDALLRRVQAGRRARGDAELRGGDLDGQLLGERLPDRSASGSGTSSATSRTSTASSRSPTSRAAARSSSARTTTRSCGSSAATPAIRTWAPTS